MKRSGFKLTHFLAAIFIASILVFVFIFFTQEIKKNAYKIICAKNLKTLYKAMQTYASNYNGNYPTAEQWCDLLVEYSDVDIKKFTCKAVAGDEPYHSTTSPISEANFPPNLIFIRDYNDNQDDHKYLYLIKQSHYALNPNTNPNSPTNTVLLFETKKDWNHFGIMEIASIDNHFPNGCNVLFSNGKVKFIKPDEVAELNWGGKKQTVGSNNVYSDLELFFTQILNKEEVVTVTVCDTQIKQGDPNRLLDILKSYTQSENVGVRSIAHNIQARVAKHHPTTEIKQEVVERLVDGLVSKSELDIGLHETTYGKLLLDFREEDFSENAKSKILNALQEENARRPVILISGVAQLMEALPLLKEIMKKREVGFDWYYTRRWAARLARARMGVQADIDKCIKLVETIDNLTRKVMILRSDIAYIRQPEAIEHLKPYFLSDLRLSPTNPNMEGELVAKYLLPTLIDTLANFPIEKKISRGMYTQEEIELCRSWMSRQRQWKIVK